MVVRKFKNNPNPLQKTNATFISSGELDKGFYLFLCYSIYSEICVVPNYKVTEIDQFKNGYHINSKMDQFFVVSNQSSWLMSFKEVFNKVLSIRREDLLSKGKEKYEQYVERRSRMGWFFILEVMLTEWQTLFGFLIVFPNVCHPSRIKD